MIETIVATFAVKGGARLLRAAVEDRDLGSEDAGDVASALLEAIVASQRKADSDRVRIEQKLDKLSTDPFEAAMTSGTRLLEDAAPAHRRPEDRRHMLADARQTFANAIGHAHGRPVDVARAEVMYGLTWAALGSGADMWLALNRATRILQLEAITSFQLVCQWEREQEARRVAPANRFREAVLGPSSASPDWTASNRWTVAKTEYEGLWRLRIAADPTPALYPRLLGPHGTAYSHPRPGLPVRVSVDTPQQLVDTVMSLGPAGLHVEHRGDSPVKVALISPMLDSERIISPDVSRLDGSGTVVLPRTKVLVPHAGPGIPAACVSLGQAERTDLAVLLHSALDWSFSSFRTLTMA